MSWRPPEELIRTSADYAFNRLKEQYPPGKERGEPFFWVPDAAGFLGIHDSQFRQLKEKGVVKPFRVEGRDLLTPTDIHLMRDHLKRNAKHKEFETKSPTGKPYVIAISNLKGGSGKSTLSVHAAAWFSLKGYRTLLIDADPQGSSTTMMGFLPVLDLDPNNSHPLMIQPDESLFSVFETEQILHPRSTFWNGSAQTEHHLDLVPAVIDDYYGEMILTSKINEGKESHTVLRKAIDESPTSSNYDVVIIDTPPSFSYATINAVYAAHALMIPVPPHSLDFQATLSYFDKLDEIFDELSKTYPGTDNRIHYIKTVPIKLDMQKESIENYALMQDLFGDLMSDTVIYTSKAFRASSQYNLTIYEGFSQGLFSRKVYRETAQNFDKLFSDFESHLTDYWKACAKPQLSL
jgi:chromosome partitioning protein